jgi:hypothetical protein
MKKIFKTIAASVSAAILLVSCNPYDDSALSGRVDDLEERVTEIEKTLKDLQTNVDGLSTIVKALEQEERIKDIRPLEDGTGYVIEFTKLGPMTIMNGNDSSISVELGEDGIYYWIVNGEPMLDNGNKVPAYIAPQFRATDDGQIQYSINGNDWFVVEGSEGLGLIKDVQQNDEDVTFILNNGETIVIPKVGFRLAIELSSYGVAPGKTISIDYSIIDGDDQTKVKVYPDQGYTASVDAVAKKIKITVPEENSYDGEVFVVAVSGKGQVSGKIISFGERITQILNVNKTATISKKGGNVTLNIETNRPYNTMIDPECASWISYAAAPATKSDTRKDNIVFSVLANESGVERTGKVHINWADIDEEFDGSGTNTDVFMIVQVEETEVDINTFNDAPAGTKAYSEGMTASGWTAKDYLIFDSSLWNKKPIDLALVLNGDVEKNNRMGSFVSPSLENGCGLLTIRYGNSMPKNTTNSKYLKFKVSVMNSAGEVKFEQIVNKETWTQYEEYEEQFAANVAGPCTIKIENIAESGKPARGDAANLVVLLSVSYRDYSE